MISPASFSLLRSRTLDIALDPRLGDRDVQVSAGDLDLPPVHTIGGRATVGIPDTVAEGTPVAINSTITAADRVYSDLFYDGIRVLLWTGDRPGIEAGQLFYPRREPPSQLRTGAIAQFKDGIAEIAVYSETAGVELARQRLAPDATQPTNGLAWVDYNIIGDLGFPTVAVDAVLSIGFIGEAGYVAARWFVSDGDDFSKTVACPE